MSVSSRQVLRLYRFLATFCKGLQIVFRPTCIQLPILSILLAGSLSGCHTSTTYNNRGVGQFQRGDYQSALDTFQNAIAANPNDADAYYNLAATLHYWGRRSSDANMMDQAESLYHRCLDLSGNHVDCYRALAVLLVDTDRRDDAFTLLEGWAQRSPQLASPLVELARLNEEYGRDDAARQYLTRALDVDASSSRAWAALGRLREEEGRYAQALTNYRHAYNLNRYHAGVPERIASLQHRLARGPISSDPTARLSSTSSDFDRLYGPTADRSQTDRITRSSAHWVPNTR